MSPCLSTVVENDSRVITHRLWITLGTTVSSTSPATTNAPDPEGPRASVRCDEECVYFQRVIMTKPTMMKAKPMTMLIASMSGMG